MGNEEAVEKSKRVLASKKCISWGRHINLQLWKGAGLDLMGGWQVLLSSFLHPEPHIVSRSLLAQADCGQGLITYRPLGVAVHSLTHREPSFLFSLQHQHCFWKSTISWVNMKITLWKTLEILAISNIFEGLLHVRHHAAVQKYSPSFQGVNQRRCICKQMTK